MPFNVNGFGPIPMLFLHAYLLGHFAVRQTDLRLAIRHGHSELFHYNKRANIIHDV